MNPDDNSPQKTKNDSFALKNKLYEEKMKAAGEALKSGNNEEAKRLEKEAIAVASGDKPPTSQLNKYKNPEQASHCGMLSSPLGNDIACLVSRGGRSGATGTGGFSNLTIYMDKPSRIAIRKDRQSDSKALPGGASYDGGLPEYLDFVGAGSLTLGEPVRNKTINQDGLEVVKLAGKLAPGKTDVFKSHARADNESAVRIPLNDRNADIFLVTVPGVELDLREAYSPDSAMGRRFNVSPATTVMFGSESSACKVTIAAPKTDTQNDRPTIIRVPQENCSRQKVGSVGTRPSCRIISGGGSAGNHKFMVPMTREHDDSYVEFPKASDVIVEIYDKNGKTVGVLPLTKNGNLLESEQQLNAKIEALGAVLNQGTNKGNGHNQDAEKIKPPPLPSQGNYR